MRRPFIPALLVVLILAAACDPGTFVPKVDDTQFAPSLGVDLAASTRTESGLYYRDITVGTGTLVADTGSVAVRTSYSVYLRNGTSIESGSVNFATNTGAVIIGYDEGVRGMRVGGRRQLILSPRLGYGNTPQGPIPANSILVYTVDLTRVD